MVAFQALTDLKWPDDAFDHRNVNFKFLISENRVAAIDTDYDTNNDSEEMGNC